MARDKEEGASVRLLLLPSLVQPQSGSTWTKKRFATETCMYIYIHTHTYIHTRVCTHAYTVVSFERKMERDSWAAMQVLWKEEERERERRRKAKSKRERKKRKEREGRGTTTTVFILEKG